MEDNVKYFLKSLKGDTSTVGSLTPENMQALRRAVVNSQKRLAQWENDFAKYGPDPEAEDYYRMKKTPYIDYYDYSLGNKVMPFNNPSIKAILSDSKNSPDYNMATTVGRAYYKQLPTGEIWISDTYDFPKDIGVASPALQALQNLGANVGKPYRIEVNLGNPKFWKL